MKGHGKFNTDNRGFSLVEIIIVMAIMAAVSGVMGYGLSLVNSRPAKECASKLASAISHGRTVTLGKYKNEITVSWNESGQLIVTENTVISVDSDGNAAQTSERTSVVGSKGITVEYKTSSDDYKELGEGDSVTLQYDTGSGAMKKTVDGEHYYTGFRISKAGKSWYVILEPLTGRISYSASYEADS